MKQVKIIGLSVNSDVGVIKAHQLSFDDNNKLIVFKGGVGEGKTTEQRILQLSTQGSKTLTDKNLYGEIDSEVQLIDGEKNIWIACKGKEGKLTYVLYEKDDNGKVIKNPVIDGISATPAKYLEALQTELTWNMDKLTSENPTIQRDILLKLYQSQFIKLGVVFDKKLPSYKDSILGQLDAAKDERNRLDMIRKQKGGIKEDLIAQGFNPERPETIPALKNIEEVEAKIQAVEKEITILETKSDSAKEKELLELKNKGVEKVSEIIGLNSKKQADYDSKYADWVKKSDDYTKKLEAANGVGSALMELVSLEVLKQDDFEEISRFIDAKLHLPKEAVKPVKPELIPTESGKVKEFDPSKYTDAGNVQLISELNKIYNEYFAKSKEEVKAPDLSSQKAKIENLKDEKQKAEVSNKIFDAVVSYEDWAVQNAEVANLQEKYRKLLLKVETGVEGLHIMDDNGNLFLMYDGSYSPEYFGNKNKELRKVSAYSGTQKPIICLLIQSYHLSLKPKAMRYMYIDNVPIDNKTRDLLERVCEELDITVFLNLTGDFDRKNLASGEVLIEGGEVFFNE